jgi:hypothetical protein
MVWLGDLAGIYLETLVGEYRTDELEQLGL